MPTCLIHDDDGVRAGGDSLADLGQVQVHRVGIAPWQHQSGAGAAGRADRAENIGPFRTLIMRRAGASAAPGPAPGNLVLLADARLVLEPNFQCYAAADFLPDFFQCFGECFLKWS